MTGRPRTSTRHNPAMCRGVALPQHRDRPPAPGSVIPQLGLGVELELLLSRRGPDAHRAATRPEQIREKCGGTCAPLGWPLTSAGPGGRSSTALFSSHPEGPPTVPLPRGQLPPGGRDRPPGPDGLPSARVALTFSCAGVPGGSLVFGPFPAGVRVASAALRTSVPALSHLPLTALLSAQASAPCPWAGWRQASSGLAWW